MTENSGEGFDLNTMITTRLDGDTEPDTDTHLQAVAVLIDAGMTDDERGDSFASVMTTMLAGLSTDERERFCQIAYDEGEVAAMSYLSYLTRPMNGSDRK